MHAILDIVERGIQPGSRGTRVFPFNRIEIAVLAPSREARGRLEAVFGGDPPLPARIVQRLQSGGCATADIVVSIDYAARGPKNWRTREFDVAFGGVADQSSGQPAVEATPARIELGRRCARRCRAAQLFVPGPPDRPGAMRGGEGQSQPPRPHQSRRVH